MQSCRNGMFIQQIKDQQDLQYVNDLPPDGGGCFGYSVFKAHARV